MFCSTIIESGEKIDKLYVDVSFTYCKNSLERWAMLGFNPPAFSCVLEKKSPGTYQGKEKLL